MPEQQYPDQLTETIPQILSKAVVMWDSYHLTEPIETFVDPWDEISEVTVRPKNRLTE
jgi:hypothetical protein